jgi:hypothetical protein
VGGAATHEKMRQAWLAAAKELGIEVVAPFTLKTSDGQAHEFLALVRNFGGGVGTLVTSLDNDEVDAGVTDDTGYNWSALNTSTYATYDRETFIEALEDWGWSGPPDKKPGWYTGLYDRDPEGM